MNIALLDEETFTDYWELHKHYYGFVGHSLYIKQWSCDMMIHPRFLPPLEKVITVNPKAQLQFQKECFLAHKKSKKIIALVKSFEGTIVFVDKYIEKLHSDDEVVSKKGRIVNATGPLVNWTWPWYVQCFAGSGKGICTLFLLYTSTNILLLIESSVEPCQEESLCCSYWMMTSPLMRQWTSLSTSSILRHPSKSEHHQGQETS